MMMQKPFCLYHQKSGEEVILVSLRWHLLSIALLCFLPPFFTATLVVQPAICLDSYFAVFSRDAKRLISHSINAIAQVI